MNTDAFDLFLRRRPGSGSMKRGLVLAAGLLVLTSASGCGLLKAGPDHSRYFVLSSTAGDAVKEAGRKRRDVHFGLGPIKLPGYLDTQSIVRTDSSGRIEYVPDAYWGEPLENGFARALLYRTGARIGTAHATAFPWYANAAVDWKVPVDVLRFEATSDGKAVLVARWTVERTEDNHVVTGGQTSLEESAGRDPVLIVDALSRCIDRLAEEIAAAVTGPRAAGSSAAGAAAAGGDDSATPAR